MDILLVALIVVVVVIDRRRALAGRRHVERWAEDNGMGVKSCRYRYLRLHRRPQFVVTMTGSGGTVGRGIATVAGRNGRKTTVALDGASAGAR